MLLAGKTPDVRRRGHNGDEPGEHQRKMLGPLVVPALADVVKATD